MNDLANNLTINYFKPPQWDPDSGREYVILNKVRSKPFKIWKFAQIKL